VCRGVGRSHAILIALAAFFLILLTVVALTVRSIQSNPWDHELMYRTVLAELRLGHQSTIWNPTRVDLDQYADSAGMAYARRAMEHVEDDGWRRKYDLYFGGRKRILRDLGGADDPIALEALRLRCHDDSILISKYGGQGHGSSPDYLRTGRSEQSIESAFSMIFRTVMSGGRRSPAGPATAFTVSTTIPISCS
jgi:hypothetical protein